jgi:hypothetical protein
MRLLAAVAAMGLLVAGQAVAQASAYGPIDPTPAAMAHSRHLMSVMHLDVMMDQMTRQMMGAMMTSTLASLPPEKRDAGEAMAESMTEDMRAMTPKLADAMVQIYARNLTEQELADIDAFYSSPSGQAVVTKIPQLTSKVMPLAMAEMPVMMRHAFDRFCSKTTCTPADRAAMEKVVQNMAPPAPKA